MWTATANSTAMKGTRSPRATRTYRLDYAFVPEAFKAELQRCEVVKGLLALKEASDHLPLLTEVALK